MTQLLDEILRREGGQVLATLIRLTGDIDRAEDALQDAVASAVEAWRVDGAPERPGAWLTTVARNKALDRIRREARRAPKEAEAFRLLADGADVDDEGAAVADSGDDRLRLLFTCCHPALAREAQVALALRTICRLTTAEIARLFLVSEPTVAQRISRAKSKIARARIPYRVPPAHELPDRLTPVLTVIYLVFTTGHHAHIGELQSRAELAKEAIRLGRMTVELMPDESECVGLLALMIATDARRATRVDVHDDVILLRDQDRRRWDHAAIGEAAEMVESVLRRGRPGPYQMQAAIACLHGLAPSYEETDWSQVGELYRLLEVRWPTPVVRINRSVAVAEAVGPEAALALLDEVTAAAAGRWHLYWSTRAEYHRRLGQLDLADDAYGRALECHCNDADRRFLERQRSELRDIGAKVRPLGVSGRPATTQAHRSAKQVVSPAAE